MNTARKFSTIASVKAREIIDSRGNPTVEAEVYVKNTGKDFDTLSKDMYRDNFMTAEEAVAYGLADKIVEERT